MPDVALDAPRRALFDNSEDGSDDDSGGGVELKVNDGYAKRFEHNKRREELHRRTNPYQPLPPTTVLPSERTH